MTGNPIPASGQRNYALAPLQGALWLHQMTGAAPGANLLQVSLALKGPVDSSRLQQAWARVLGRHDALRVSFHWRGTESVEQHVHASVPVPWVERDLRTMAPAERAALIEACLVEERGRGFDLDQPPLYRVVFLRLSEAESLLIWTIHHLLADDRSLAIVIEEVGAEYAAGKPPQADRPIPRLFSDFVQQSRGTALDPAQAYWRGVLRGISNPTRLARPVTIPSTRDLSVGRSEARLGREVSEHLRTLAQAHGVSLRTVGEAAWALLLHRYTGDEDVLFGVSRDGRTPEFAGTVGLFLNTLPWRAVVPRTRPVWRWLQDLERADLERTPHTQVPIGRVRAWSEVTADQPLFESLIHFEAEPIDQWLRAGSWKPWIASVDLLEQTEVPWVGAILAGPELRLRVAYERRDFDEETGTRLLRHWQALLEAMANHPELTVGQLPWLTPAERQCLLVDWNATQTHYPRDSTVADLVAEQARRTPTAVAVEFGGASLTYQQLDTRAEQLAAHLRARGIGRDARVPVCGERSIELMVGLLAILKAGGAYVPLDPDYPAERLAFMLADAHAELVLTQSRIAPRLPPSAAQLLYLDRWDWTQSFPAAAAAPPGPAADSLAYVIYTSGSTGRPKGVAMVHRALVNLLAWHRQSLPPAPGERTLQFTSLSFDVSFQEIFTTWSTGGTLVLMTEALRRDPAGLLQYLQQQRISRLFLPFVALQQLAEAAQDSATVPATLNHVFTAGEQLQVTPTVRALFERLPGTRLHNHYGPSETHVVTAYTLPEDRTTWPAFPPIGRPIANTTLYILDPERKPAPVGVPGELFLGGDCLARGYLDRPELTAERFLDETVGAYCPDRAEAGTAMPRSIRMYRTGDRARYLADGNVEFLGRLDDQVKIRGFRVELGEIEMRLRAHPSIRECAVVVTARNNEKHLVAYLVGHRGQAQSSEVVREFLRTQLADYMVPAHYVWLERLPLTPSGKLNRRALPPLDFSRAAAAATLVAPKNELEQTIAAVWQTVLGVPQVSTTESFFELGGTSLMILQVQRRLREALRRELPITLLFQYPTVAGLAQHLAEPARPSPAGSAALRDRAARQRDALARSRPDRSVSGPRAGARPPGANP